MIQIPYKAKIYLMSEPFYSEHDIDDRVAVCKRNKLDPFSGDLFVAKNEDASRIGILGYDGHGFHWCIKRFSEGQVAWWPDRDEAVEITANVLQVLLWGGNPERLELPSMWRALNKA